MNDTHPAAAPRVLSVGNCGFDHSSISQLLARHFSAKVEPASSARDTVKLLTSRSYDLILVNRQFDGDGDSGLELIKRIKADPALAATPVMLISNYANYQQQAVEAGALPGFGKSELSSEQTRERIRQALTQGAPESQSSSP